MQIPECIPDSLNQNQGGAKTRESTCSLPPARRFLHIDVSDVLCKNLCSDSHPKVQGATGNQNIRGALPTHVLKYK